MKTNITNIILTIFLSIIFSNTYSACELYSIDFLNNQLSGPTYDVTCADNVTPSQWRVKNNTCILTTTPVTLPGPLGTFVTTPLSVTINRTGNLGCNDYVLIQYQINGVWYTQDSISACNMTSNQQTINFNVTCGAQSVIGVRVILSTTAPVEKWFIRDADVCISTPFPVLPIELVEFIAISESGKVKLNWSTASETNNDFFTIEKSEDGIIFNELEIIKGAGNSQHNNSYSSIDENPYYGIVYYRLKQTDFNGNFDYSKTISARYDITKSERGVIYPNPCDGGNFNLTLSGCKDKDVLVVLFDAMGNKVFSKVVLEKNETFYTAIDPNKKLNPGIYMVVGSSQEKVFFNHRLIVR